MIPIVFRSKRKRIRVLPIIIPLYFDSFGDTNGVFYYLGNNNGWTNPATNGNLTITASSVFIGTVAEITDRVNSSFHTGENPNPPWVQFDLGTKKLKLNYWTYRSKPSFFNIPDRLIVSGSDDGNTFTQLDDFSFIIAPNQNIGRSVSSSASYPIIRFTMPQQSTGQWFFTISEIEIYGDLTI